MKTKMKSQGSAELPRFAVGALAIAGASAANAAVVQISFANNTVSMSSGIGQFIPDLTGDGIDEVEGALFGSYGVQIRRLSRDGGQLAIATSGSASVFLGKTWVPTADRGLVSAVFQDTRINDGLPTAGFIDIQGLASSSSASLQIHRLIFDDESTTAPTGVTASTTGLSEWGANAVPEPSSLGLLALGAGGLLARRRRVG